MSSLENLEGPERLAQAAIEAIKRTNEIETTALIARGHLISMIKRRNLWEYLPNRYNSAEEAIEAETGLSRTQQSIAETLASVLLPYASERGMLERITQIPKSNLAEILPVARTLITGEASKSKRVNEKATELMHEFGDPDTALEHVLSLAETLPTAELRRSLQRDTDPIQFVLYVNGDRMFLLAEVDEPQVECLRRMSFVEMTTVVNEPPNRLPILKSILGGSNE